MIKRTCFILSIVLFLLISNLLHAQKDNTIGLFNTFSQFYSKGDLINAEKCLMDIIVQKDIIPGEYLIASYNNLGVINIRLGKYEDALGYLNLAESKIVNDKLSLQDLADVYINKARIYGIQREDNQAIEYLEQGINIYLSIKNPNSSVYFRISSVYINLGLTYLKKEEYKKALVYLEKSKNLKLKFNLSELAFTNLNIAKTYAKLNDNLSAQKYFLEAISNFNLEFGKEYYRIAEAYFDYSLFLQSIGKSIDALDIRQKALVICLKNYGEKHTLVSLAYKHLGDHFFLEKDYQTALKYYQKSLIAVVTDFNNTDIYSNPQLNSVIFDIRLLENLKQKAKALELFSQLQSDSSVRQKAMIKGLETIELAIQLIERIRNGYLSTESKIYLAENEKETYFFAVQIAKELFELTDRSEYLYQMYSICCKSKSAILRNEINDNELVKGIIATDSVKDKNNKITINIASYSKLIQDEMQKRKPDSMKIRFWKTNLFDLNREKEKVNKKIKNLFPQFEAIVNKTEPAGVKEIQRNLDNNTTLVEYFLSNQYLNGERQIFIFIIGKKNLNYFSTALDSSYSNQIDVFKIGTINNSTTINQNFVDALYYMYEKLIKPIEKNISGKRIIVVPDEELAYLPFDSFIKEKAIISQVGFDNLKYLIYDYTMSYAYTSFLLFNQEHRHSSNTVLAFSPDYGKSAFSNASEYSTLMGTGREIGSIFKWFKGFSYIGSKATESNFKQLSKQPAIYHLAMHSSTDSNNSKYSYLIFDSQFDSINDGKLFNYEIETSTIESPMVVLSACNTGSGSLYHGEGVMSLARGFILAGATSVVSTFWDVNDDASSTIMIDFYNQLSMGKAKDDALRIAKLNYLRTTSPSYTKPSYWAAYELIGDSAPIKYNNRIYLYIGLTIVGLTLLFYLKRLRRS